MTETQETAEQDTDVLGIVRDLIIPNGRILIAQNRKMKLAGVGTVIHTGEWEQGVKENDLIFLDPRAEKIEFIAPEGFDGYTLYFIDGSAILAFLGDAEETKPEQTDEVNDKTSENQPIDSF